MVQFLCKMRNVLRRMKNQFSDFWVIDFVHNFLVFLPTKKNFFQKWPNLHGRCAMSWNEWKINFAIFRFWDMVDFVLNFRHFFSVRGFRSPKPPVFVRIHKVAVLTQNYAHIRRKLIFKRNHKGLPNLFIIHTPKIIIFIYNLS